MNEVLKAKVIAYLAQQRMDSMFGDGLEMDYILNGTTIVGLNEMSDSALIEELEMNEGETEADDLLNQVRTV